MQASTTFFDIIIIGGGVIGSSIAYHVARQGGQVLVVERAEVAVEPAASWASAGGVRRQGRHRAEALLATEAIERWPTYFAAAAPVSGAGDPTRAALLTNLPIWVFHGSKDSRVPVSGSRDMVNAIRAKGGKPRYTEFAGAGHGIWGRVYGFDATGRVDGFYPWLFSQSKAQVQGIPQ